MKRVLSLAIVAVLFTGCNQTEADKEHADTTTQFEQAADLQERAHSGTVDNIKDKPYGKTVEDYRFEKLGESTTILRTLATRGDAKQQIAAHQLLSEAEKSEALRSVRDAIVTWAKQAPASTELLSLASDIRLSRANANDTAAVDLTPQLAEANAALSELQKQKEQLTAEAKTLSDAVKELESKIAEFDKQRTDKSKQADELNRKAFAAKGQESFDLYAKAAELTKASDNITAEREKADSIRDARQSELDVLNAKISNLTAEDGQIPGVQAAIDELQDRAAKLKERASAARTSAEESTAAFNEAFDAFTKTQSEQINARFTAAAEQLNKAIDDAKAAASRSAEVQSTQSSVNVEQAARQTLLGFVFYRQMLVDGAYRDVLKGLSTAIEPVDADKAKSISDAAATADERITTTKEAANNTFNAAVEQLEKIAEQAKTAKNERIEAAALELQIAALGGLAAVNDDPAKASRVGELRTRRNALSAD